MSAPFAAPAFARLSNFEKVLLIAAGVAILAFGALVVKRSAYGSVRRTDAGVYFRAAWAVREARNIYQVTDDNRWHYVYPALLAVAMTPLADPPAGEARAGYLPYAVSVSIWYLVGILTVGMSSHLFAAALEVTWRERGEPPSTWRHRAWWSLRVWPVVGALPDIGSTLSRGQVNTLVLLLIAGAAYALARRTSLLAGGWLGAAFCIKVIPAYFMLYALVRRDWRMFAGFGAACVVGLVMVPAVLLGPARALEYNRLWLVQIGLPGLGAGDDAPAKAELLGFRGSSGQSIQQVLHNATHWTLPPHERPEQCEAWVRIVHLVIGGCWTVLTGVLLWRRFANGARPGQEPSPLQIVLTLGVLTQAMLLVSPATSIPYYALLMPIYSGLVFVTLDRGSGFPARRTMIAMLGFAAALSVSKLRGLAPHSAPSGNVLRDFGWIPGVGIVAWAMALRAMSVAAQRVTARVEAAPESLSTP